MSILNDLIQIRKEKKVRQYNVANHIKVTSVTLSRYEKGTRKMTFDNVCEYADYLGYELRLLKKI